MRPIAVLHPTDGVPVPPDAVTILLIAGSSGQAFDWQSGAQIARLSGMSTAGATLNFMANLQSTAAAAPSSGSSGGSTGIGYPVMGQSAYQIPGGSTGGSVAALSSGYILIEQWRKGG